MIIEYIKKFKFFFLKINKSIKAEGRMEDEDTESRLPLAIYLEDSNFTVCTTELYWVNEPQGMIGVSTMHIVQSSKLSLKVILLSEEEDKRIRAQEEMANSTLHHHSRRLWVYMKHVTLIDLFYPHNRLRGWYCYLPCKTEKTKVHRDRILSPLLFLTILYCLPGENY